MNESWILISLLSGELFIIWVGLTRPAIRLLIKGIKTLEIGGLA